MQLTIWHFLIVCPLVCLGGFVDSVAGGGGLITLPAYMLAGIPTHNAIATNKVSSFMGTTVSTVRYARSGYTPIKEAAAAVLLALPGSVLGARLSMKMEDRIFKIFMLFAVPLIAFYVLKNKEFSQEGKPLENRKKYLYISGLSFVLGLYDGFYGPGAGTFMILAYTNLAHVKLTEANGIAKAANLTTNVSSMVVYLLNGLTLLPLGLAAGVFGMVGNYLGTRFFDKKGLKGVRAIMLVVLSLFFIKLITEIL